MGTAEATMAGSQQAQDAMPRPPNEPSNKTWLGRVARRLKALRESRKLDATEAAEAITKAGYKVGRSTIFRWEAGDTFPHVEAYPAIAKVYRVAVRNILPGE